MDQKATGQEELNQTDCQLSSDSSDCDDDNSSERTDCSDNNDHSDENPCDDYPTTSVSVASVHANKTPLVDPEKLRTQQSSLIRNIVLANVMPALEPFLPFEQIDEINVELGMYTKVSKLLQYLRLMANAQQYEVFNAFIKILGGTQKDLFEMLARRSPTKEEANFCMANFTQDLKTQIQLMNHCPESEFDQKIDLDCQHTELSIVREDMDPKKHDEQLPHDYQSEMSDMRSESSQTILAQDILQGHGDKTFIVYGRAGIGKTTTIQWLARQWAFDKWASTFTALFCLQLRSLTVQEFSITCVELLNSYGLFMVDDQFKPLLNMSWLKQCASQVIIMIDGLDEVSKFVQRLHRVRSITKLDEAAPPIDLCINILKGNLLTGCTIIATSRPFSGLQQHKFDSRLEILGLSPSGINQYIQKRYKEDADRIMSFLSKNPVLLSVCGITWYCMQITSLLSANVGIVDEDVQTYTRLTAFIIVNLVSRRLYETCLFGLEVQSYLPKLAQMAYTGIFTSSGFTEMAKVVFHQSDLTENGISLEDLEAIRLGGLLQVKIKKIKTASHIDAEFLHLSVQEMLAMVHFLSKSSQNKEQLQRVFSGGQFNMACMYLFGLQYDRKLESIDAICCSVSPIRSVDMTHIDEMISAFLLQLCSKVTSDDGGAILKVCQLVHEGHQEEHAKLVADKVARAGELQIKQTKMTAIDFMAVGFVCQYVGPLTKVILKEVTADKTCLEFMSIALVRRHQETLTKLDISGNGFGDEGTIVIADELRSRKSCLELLYLDNNKITAVGAKTISEALPFTTKLQLLFMKENDLGDKGAKVLANVFASNANQSVLQFDISSNRIGPKGAKAIAKAMIKNKCLQRLGISTNPLGLSGVKSIAFGLAGSRVLKDLFMNEVAWGSSVGKDIGNALIANDSLELLWISKNNIGCAGAKAIGLGLVSHSNIKKLGLEGNNIGIEGAKGLAVGLSPKEAQIQVLYIGKNKMTWEGLREISQALDGKTMERIDMVSNLSPCGSQGLFRNVRLIVLRD